MPCGVLVVPLGDQGPALERPWASRGRQKYRGKSEEKALWYTLCVRVGFECETEVAWRRRVQVNYINTT